PYAHHCDLPSFPTRRSSDLSVAAASLLAAAIIAGFALRRGSNARPIRFTIGPPPGWTVAVDYNLGSMAVSPDGKYVAFPAREDRSEEHTSELQSRGHLVCRL